MQLPGCISQGGCKEGQKAAAGVPLALCPAALGRLRRCPGWCHGCSLQAVWLVGLSPSRPAPVCPPHSTTDPTGASARPGELSRNGSSRACWRVIPQRIYHQGLQGADSLHVSAKLQTQRGQGWAPGLQQLPGCVQDSPGESQHPTQHQSHCQGLPFGASQMQSANYVAHSSPPRAADRSQGENACFSAAIEDLNVFFFPREHWGAAQGKS